MPYHDQLSQDQVEWRRERIQVTPERKQRTSVKMVMKGHRRAMVGIAMTSFAGGLCEAVFLVVITRSAFAITAGRTRVGILGGHFLTVDQTVWLALGLVVLRVAFALLSALQSARLGTRALAHIRVELAQGFLRSSWSVQQDQRGGRLQEMLTTFASNGAGLVGSVTNMVVSGFNLAAMIGLAILVNPLGSIVVVVSVMVLGAVLRPVRGVVRRHSRAASDAGMEFATSLAEISDLGMEVHVFNVQPQTESRVSRLIAENAAINERLSFLRGLVPTLYSGLAYIALVGAVAFVATTDSTNFGSLGAVMLVMLRSLSYGQALQINATNISSSLPFVEAVHDQLDVYRAAAVSDHGRPVGAVGTLALESLSFSYVEGQPVLTDVNASIRPHEIIGIVGPSGSGKSTLVQLMLGLRSPTSGRVTADGRDIHEFARAEWARKITFVPQAAHLIAGTVKDNIRFLRDDVTDADIERAARLAHLHDDIATWPDAYLHDAGERGGHLSGGQQQRLCIARALVENPDVLILDEPTSSLDVRSESLIRETLTDMAKKVTVIVIAHRMSTLDICDRIMVIQDGRLKAFDTPENLERTSDFYRDALVLSGLR